MQCKTQHIAFAVLWICPLIKVINLSSLRRTLIYCNFVSVKFFFFYWLALQISKWNCVHKYLVWLLCSIWKHAGQPQRVRKIIFARIDSVSVMFAGLLLCFKHFWVKCVHLLFTIDKRMSYVLIVMIFLSFAPIRNHHKPIFWLVVG